MMGWEKGNMPKVLANESTLPSFFNQLSAQEQRIVTCIFNEKMIHIDDLSSKVNIGISDLLPLLLMLEFQNVVVCMPGNRYKLK
jgi:predicted Rossmann fold nucleotide-binding protein DprA/Smf involved in DNA uptake